MVYKKLVIFLPRLCFLIFAKIHLGLFLNLLKIIRRFLNFFLKNTLLMIFFLSREEKCLKYFLIEYKSLGRFLRLKNLGLCVSYKGVSYKLYCVYVTSSVRSSVSVIKSCTNFQRIFPQKNERFAEKFNI